MVFIDVRLPVFVHIDDARELKSEINQFLFKIIDPEFVLRIVNINDLFPQGGNAVENRRYMVPSKYTEHVEYFIQETEYLAQIDLLDHSCQQKIDVTNQAIFQAGHSRKVKEIEGIIKFFNKFIKFIAQLSEIICDITI